jgi:RNA polymerase sigma factor (sigma-70 family)
MPRREPLPPLARARRTPPRPPAIGTATPAVADPGPPGLPAPRERRLVAAAEAGDTAARAAIVDAFLPAIGGVARRYRRPGQVDHAELMQEGVVGLLRAVDRYDPRYETPFWAYASWWVRQAMQQLVSEMTRPAVLSDRAQRMLARIKLARRELVQANGHEPTIDELAERAELTREQVERLLSIDRVPRGTDEPVADDGGSATVGDQLADPGAEEAFDAVTDRMQHDHVRDLAATLDERERGIVESHFGLGCPVRTLREIGDGLGITAERVRQIEASALAKLRADLLP